jgi:hypothetical protein
MPWFPNPVAHARRPRRTALQVGAMGLPGLGMNHVTCMRALAADRSGDASNEQSHFQLHLSR